jgi:hypothetical protein
MPTAPATTAELLDLIRRSGVVAPDRAARLGDLNLPAEPGKAAALLVAQGLLTRFQAQQFVAGRYKGFRVGPYVIIDVLGRGGMGAVYLAEHLELRRKVAIKVLVGGRDEDQKLAVERFLREARAAAALDHPNIVRIHDVARHGDVPYLVMEYVEGDTLQAVLDRDGPVPYPAAAEYAAQAAAGLQHAHERGFVHRDVKPGNLIRDASGTVKLLDMGLARSSAAGDNLTEQLDRGAVVGTADFIAPEQGLNLAVDGRADVYSLGATFFALVTGKPPFEGNTTQKLLQHQLKPAPALSSLDPTFPTALSAVVAKMLAKKPADRHQTPAEVIAALAPWAGTSSRILAGLSRTRLAQGADLHAALSDPGRRSSQRLRGPQPDTGEVDAGAAHGGAAAAHDTAPNGGAATDRALPPPPPPTEPAPARRRRVWLAPAAAAVVLAAGVGGWLALRPGPPGPVVDNRPVPPDVPKKEDPKPPVVPPKVDPPAAGRVLYKLDLAGQEPFVTRLALTPNPKDPAKPNQVREVSHGGPGRLPGDWQARLWSTESQVEAFSDAPGGRPALGLRTVSGPASGMLFTPPFDCPTGACRLRIEYQAVVRPAGFAVQARGQVGAAWNVARPPPTAAGEWRTAQFDVDLKGAQVPRFEFHNTDKSPDAAVRVRAVEVTELPPPPGKPAGRADAATVFTLDVEKIAPFQVRKRRYAVLAGAAEKLPAGVVCGCYRNMAEGEFRRGSVDGTPALGLANLTDVKSAQYIFNLESGVKLALRPGVDYRVRIGYRTAADATGTVAVQSVPGFRQLVTAPLKNTGGEWAEAAVRFVRPPAETADDIRLIVENQSAGEGNVVWVRSLEVAEVGPADG